MVLIRFFFFLLLEEIMRVILNILSLFAVILVVHAAIIKHVEVVRDTDATEGSPDT